MFLIRFSLTQTCFLVLTLWMTSSCTEKKPPESPVLGDGCGEMQCVEPSLQRAEGPMDRQIASESDVANKHSILTLSSQQPRQESECSEDFGGSDENTAGIKKREPSFGSRSDACPSFLQFLVEEVSLEQFLQGAQKKDEREVRTLIDQFLTASSLKKEASLVSVDFVMDPPPNQLHLSDEKLWKLREKRFRSLLKSQKIDPWPFKKRQAFFLECFKNPSSNHKALIAELAKIALRKGDLKTFQFYEKHHPAVFNESQVAASICEEALKKQNLEILKKYLPKVKPLSKDQYNQFLALAAAAENSELLKAVKTEMSKRALIDQKMKPASYAIQRATSSPDSINLVQTMHAQKENDRKLAFQSGGAQHLSPLMVAVQSRNKEGVEFLLKQYEKLPHFAEEIKKSIATGLAGAFGRLNSEREFKAFKAYFDGFVQKNPDFLQVQTQGISSSILVNTFIENLFRMHQREPQKDLYPFFEFVQKQLRLPLFENLGSAPCLKDPEPQKQCGPLLRDMSLRYQTRNEAAALDFLMRNQDPKSEADVLRSKELTPKQKVLKILYLRSRLEVLQRKEEEVRKRNSKSPVLGQLQERIQEIQSKLEDVSLSKNFVQTLFPQGVDFTPLQAQQFPLFEKLLKELKDRGHAQAANSLEQRLSLIQRHMACFSSDQALEDPQNVPDPKKTTCKVPPLEVLSKEPQEHLSPFEIPFILDRLSENPSPSSHSSKKKKK